MLAATLNISKVSIATSRLYSFLATRSLNYNHWILASFKISKPIFRRFLLRFILAKIEECTPASDVAKSVDLLMENRCVACAWKDVVHGTISKCFRKAGVLDSGMGVVGRGVTEETDLFEDFDAESQLQDFISRAMPTDDSCSVDEYINGEESLPVCSDFGDDSWNETLQEIGEPSQISDKEKGEDDESQEISPPKIKSFKEAISALEDV